jgi:hypothetical protein
MLVGVKVALKLWLIIFKSRFKIEKSSFYKNSSKKSNLNYLFYKLSSQVKGIKDIKAVWFEFEFTSYILGHLCAWVSHRVCSLFFFLRIVQVFQEEINSTFTTNTFPVQKVYNFFECTNSGKFIPIQSLVKGTVSRDFYLLFLLINIFQAC